MSFFLKRFLAVCLLLSSSSVLPGVAACLTPPASADRLDAFKSDPMGLLNRYPLGSGSMASEIRVLAASDAGVLGAIVGLAKGANDAQKSAIAAGMAQAAIACQTQDPALALQIQEAILSIDNKSISDQFAAITGNTKTGATGAGGGAGGGGGAAGAGGASGEGGQSGGANNSSNNFAGGSRTTSGPSGFSVSASSASQAGTTTRTLNAATSTVSPSQ